MTAVWIALGAALLLGAALAGRARVRARRAERYPGRIVNLGDATFLDRSTGAVRSVQRAELLLDEADLERIWTPEHLERLARTYWRFLTRVTLGAIRVHYTPTQRSVVLLTEPLRLLTFQAPEYEMDGSRGMVRWRIERGLLVSRRGRGGRGYLQIEITRHDSAEPGRAVMRVAVEVANFYPSIASAISNRLYNLTQSRIHVIVTYGFLRSLARLDLAPSRVGRFAPVPN